MTQRPKRILFISHHGTLSGAPISLLTLMKYFRAHRDWDCRVIMRKAGPLRAEFEAMAPTAVFYQHYLDPRDMRPAGAAIAHPPKNALMKRMKQWVHEARLRRWARAFAPDLVYSNTSVNGDVLKKLAIAAPTLVHVRELEATISLYNNTQLDALRSKDIAFFAVSEFVKNYLGDRFDVAPGRVSIVPGSIEPERFDALAAEIAENEIRRELALPEDALIVGAAGSVDSRKGADIFVDAAIRALGREDAPRNLYFVWIGAGAMMNDVRQRIAQHGLESRIMFASERKNPYPYIRLFDIGLMTSRDDPFPRSVMEMAAFGAPAICFREGGGAAEFVGDDAGLILNTADPQALADAILKLVRTSGERERFSIAARKKARENYSTNVVGARAAALIDGLLG